MSLYTVPRPHPQPRHATPHRPRTLLLRCLGLVAYLAFLSLLAAGGIK
jgi:hypothetical protein